MAEIQRQVLPEQFEPILDTVIDAVIILTKEGTIVGWNDVAEIVFGWTRAEAIGRLLGDLVVPTQHRAAHREGMARLEAGGSPKLLNQRLELPALRKDGSEIPVELSITTSRGTGREYFIGFLRDISERHRLEALLRREVEQMTSLLNITQQTSEADSFEEAVRTVLKAICDSTGWQAGHAFLVDPKEPDQLIASMIWHEKIEGCANRIKQASEGLVFARGEGLPGRVLDEDGPVWLSDIDQEGNFIRQGFEFRGAFGFPLRSHGRITAVLEFFSENPSAPDEAQLLLAQALGSQIGRALERSETNEQREVLLHELNHRSKNLLTVIQSIARVTFQGDARPEEQVDTFNARLSAMARAQDLLVNHQWADSTMRDTVLAAISGFESYRDRFTISGPDIPVRAADVQTNVLMLHELCTNALKYGALSVEDGRVDIEWGFDGEGAARHFFFRWKETGCALDGEPEHAGFGTSLLRRGFGAGSGTKVEIRYPPDGLLYTMTSPAAAGEPT